MYKSNGLGKFGFVDPNLIWYVRAFFLSWKLTYRLTLQAETRIKKLLFSHERTFTPPYVSYQRCRCWRWFDRQTFH
jgi:hypothetical protein